MAKKSKYSPEAWKRRSERSKKYKQENPDKAWHNRYIAQTYKVTKEQYDALLASQGGFCAICGGPPDRLFYCIDHSHKTGKIRGLLCHKCNSGIGMFQECLANIKKAVEYIERYGE